MIIPTILVKIAVFARNLNKIKCYFPDIKFGEIIVVPQSLAKKLSSTIKLKCICDNCSSYYSITASSKKLNSEFFCGNCRLKFANDKMKITVRTLEFRKKRSQIVSDFYKTERGQTLLKIKGRNHSIWIQNHPELIEKWTKNLKHYSGEDNPNFNPNKSEFEKYRKIVLTLTNENYEKFKDEINPHNVCRKLNGTKNGYQLDHIISIKYGFDNKILPKIIASKENLQMLTWEENRAKWK